MAKYIFTDKKYSPKSIMSTVLGLISDGALAYAIYSTYKNAGIATQRLGSSGTIILLMSTIGVVLGVVSKSEQDNFYLFSYIGLILNVIALLMVSMILYAGAYGI